jgi:aspartyl-tRNA(Asn)/glutamyl-tRNA(Gln) amidotransferase subunit A
MLQRRRSRADACPRERGRADAAFPVARSRESDCPQRPRRSAGVRSNGRHDPADPRSVAVPVPDVVGSLDAPVAGLTLAIADNHAFRDVDPEIRDVIDAVAAVPGRAGVTVKRVSLPDPQPMMDAIMAVVRAESAAIHRGRCAALPHVQPFVRDRIRAGLALTAVDYLDARAAVARLRTTFVRQVFGVADAVLLPMLPGPPTVAEATAGTQDEIAARMARFAWFARFVNGLGVPAVAIPAAAVGAHALSFQVLAAPFSEDVVLRLGQAYARADR